MEIQKIAKYKEAGSLVKYHTDRSDVLTLRLELPKEIHESTKWSSWTPGDITHIFWEPLCNFENNHNDGFKKIISGRFNY